MNIKIKLPHHARKFVRDCLRCPSCIRKLFEADVVSVGVGRAKDKKLYLRYECVCPGCRKTMALLDQTREITNSDWWQQIAEWHLMALVDIGPLQKNVTDRGGIPLLVGPPPLKRADVVCGYRGDVGPVVLYCQGIATDGRNAVRLERKERIRILKPKDEGNMPDEHWYKFMKLKDGAVIELAGQPYTKLSKDELREFVQDRVFRLTRERRVTTLGTKPGGRYGNLQPAPSRKKDRGPSRDPRKVDSRRRRT